MVDRDKPFMSTIFKDGRAAKIFTLMIITLLKIVQAPFVLAILVTAYGRPLWTYRVTYNAL